MSTKQYDTVIIGGGPAGIATALRRRKRGESVLLVEQNDKIGGKLDVYHWEGYRWDKGPSLFTLPETINELFELFDKNPKDYFDYHLIDENCRYHFNDGTHFTLYSDAERRKEELSKVFSKLEVNKVEKYIAKIGKLYEAIGELFIAAPKLNLSAALKPKVVKHYPKIVSRQMLYSLNAYNKRMLGNDKLVQLFNRYGTYNGSNPYQMSGLYSMIPHLELNIGTYFPIGGMRAIIDSLEKLAIEEGVLIKCKEQNTHVHKSPEGYTVQLQNETITANNLVCAMDHLNFYKHVIKDQTLFEKYVKEPRSSSAIVFYWAVEGNYPEIGLHNILFSEDYENEFDELFNKRETPSEPTIYIHNSSAVEKSDAPENGQNWFVMVHSPAGIEPSDEKLKELRNLVKQKVKNLIGIDLEGKIKHESYWSMRKIAKDTGSFMGALYGGAFNTKTSSFTRHGNDIPKYKDLFFAGGSVHPGGGIPLVMKSAKIVDELIEKNG